VTYAAVARLCGIARSTVIDVVRKLVEIGLIQKIKRRVMVRWGRGQGASREPTGRECLRFQADRHRVASAVDR
jgi:hypothetical protein